MTQNLIPKARLFCETHKYRFTRPREYVLMIIANSKKPLGAYEILDQLSHRVTNPKPPTVYRAIEFWQKHGFIHRIESLNAYISCEAGHRHHGAQVMICDDCGTVIETHICELPQSLTETANITAFTPSRWNLEIHGICGECS